MISVNTKKEDTTLYVTVEGSLGTADAPEFQDKLDSELTEDIKELVIDMAGLEYLSSSGLRTLLLATRTVEKQGGEMKVTNVNDEVQYIFKVTGFHDILNII